MTKTRGSEACMQVIQSSINEEEIYSIEKKRIEWEQAVTDELKLLDEKQTEFENKLGVEEELDELGSPKLRLPTVAIFKHQINEKFDALATSVENLRTDRNTEILALKNEIKVLKGQNTTFGKEIDGLIDKISKLSAQGDGYQDQGYVDASLATIKKFFFNGIQKIRTEYNHEISILKETIKNLKRASPNVSTKMSEASHKIKLDIPKFRGLENKRPIKFLPEFEKYINVVQPNFEQSMSNFSSPRRRGQGMVVHTGNRDRII